MARRGPRTPEGIAASSRNATRHGLYSEALVVAGETLEDWQRFHDGVIESFAPQGALEAALAGRVAALLWRLRRVPAAEASLVARARPVPGHQDPPLLPLFEGRSLYIIARAEAHLDRKLRRTLHQLEALRDLRERHGLPLAGIDAHGLEKT